MPIRLGCKVDLIEVQVISKVSLGLSPCRVACEGRLEMARDVTRVTRPRWLHVLRQMMLMTIEIIHEHLAGMVRHLGRSWHVDVLARVKVR